MTDIRTDWFMNQWYSKEELQQLWEWIQEGGEFVTIQKNNDKWSGFHILDKDKKIDLAGQPTKTDCKNWMKRLGFEIKLERDGSHVHLNTGNTKKLRSDFKTSGTK